MATMTAKVCRKLDNGVRRLREADRFLKRPASKYSSRTAGQVRRPTRRVAAKVLTLHPALVQLVKQRHCVPGGKWQQVISSPVWVASAARPAFQARVRYPLDPPASAVI